jgi:nucleotide-binding universal stress UspA family protein
MIALRRTLELVSDPDCVHVVYVMQIPVAADPGVMWDMVTEETMEKHSRESFQRLGQRHPELARLKFVGLFGDPGGAVADYASEQNAELIVISSHGRTGLTRFMLGSVAERVVRLAACPVLVLKNSVDKS